ncbi:MAG: hypothetical protein MUC83_02860 [Pirellula sp.]|jgi:hypothetical protein|nr:hypothetical protein [Pirellula sp.]
MAVNSDKGSSDNSESLANNLMCGWGGCVWIMTGDGIELYEACESDCHCPSGPPITPLIPSVPENPQSYTIDSKPGVSVVYPCEDNANPREGAVTRVGYLSIRKEFKIERERKDDCCVAVSDGDGKWRYFRRGKHIGLDHEKGHMDKLAMPRGTIRLDLVSLDRLSLETPWAIGYILPEFTCA